MPIQTSDLKFKYSGTNTPGSSAAQPNPNASLGGYVSTTIWSGGVLDDLFSDITALENMNSQVDYRCIFLHNSNGTNTFLSPVVWFSANVAGGADVALGIDPTPASIVSSSGAQAVVIATGTTAPAGVSFRTPTSYATGIGLSDLLSNFVVGIWVQRSATNSTALNNDGFTLSVQGNTSG